MLHDLYFFLFVLNNVVKTYVVQHQIVALRPTYMRTHNHWAFADLNNLFPTSTRCTVNLDLKRFYIAHLSLHRIPKYRTTWHRLQRLRSRKSSHDRARNQIRVGDISLWLYDPHQPKKSSTLHDDLQDVIERAWHRLQIYNPNSPRCGPRKSATIAS